MEKNYLMNSIQALGLAGAMLVGNELMMAKAREPPASEPVPFHKRVSIHPEELVLLSEGLENALGKACMPSRDYYLYVAMAIQEKEDSGLIAITGIQARSRLRLEEHFGASQDYYCLPGVNPDVEQKKDITKYKTYVRALQGRVLEMVSQKKFSYDTFDNDAESFLLEKTDLIEILGRDEGRLFKTMHRVKLDAMKMR